VSLAVVVYLGREPEKSVGPFPDEDAVAEWCRENDVEVEFSPQLRDDDRRRGFILPFEPRG
jgi:hypothetical protein